MMVSAYNIFPLGDQAITLSLGNSISQNHHHKVVSIKEWIERQGISGILDVVVAYSSVTVLYDAFVVRKTIGTDNAFYFIKTLLENAFEQSADTLESKSRRVRIPVCYEEPFAMDMPYISESKKITVEKIIELHTAKTYRVYMIGFLPGFPYMAEVDDQLVVPRRHQPRKKVEAGSVGIAGVQTGIYPLASPGGWQIIGRTPVILFNKNNNPPVLFEPGDEVEFYAITKNQFLNFDLAQ